MKPNKPEHNQQPRPELLIAYVDGELDNLQKDSLETWLESHPEAQEDIRDYRHLSRLWQDTAPHGPADARWAAVLTRIEHRLAAEVSSPAQETNPGGHFWPALRRAGLIAASLAACFFLITWALQRVPQPTPSPERTQPFPVASDQDVEILSIDDADVVTLPVGEPPVPGPLILASGGDIVLESVLPARDGMLPQRLGMGEEQSTPMIVAPLETAP
jgi:hypothetical protein